MVDAPRPLSREKSDRKFDRYVAAYEQHGVCNWAVEDAEGAFVGYAGVMPRHEPLLGAHLSAGWRLARQVWGRGYATEAAGAAIVDAFSRLRPKEVLAYTSPDNARSQAVMARLGLRRAPSRDFVTSAERPWTGLVWVADLGDY